VRCSSRSRAWCRYEGYRLTYGGYDFLAIRAMLKRGTITGVGRKFGVGKESDIYLATNEAGDELALKLHRLGRVSFRRVKEKRDYLGHRKHGESIDTAGHTSCVR
jgi:RIO kinase 2